MSAEQRRRRVEVAYDELGSRFGEWTAKIEADPSERFLRELADRLRPGDHTFRPGARAR